MKTQQNAVAFPDLHLAETLITEITEIQAARMAVMCSHMGFLYCGGGGMLLDMLCLGVGGGTSGEGVAVSTRSPIALFSTLWWNKPVAKSALVYRPLERMGRIIIMLSNFASILQRLPGQVCDGAGLPDGFGSA